MDEQEDDENDRDDDENDLDPTQWMLTGNLAGVSVDDDLKGLCTVVVGDEPDGDENVLESACLIGAEHLEIAMGVARNFASAKLLELSLIHI